MADRRTDTDGPSPFEDTAYDYKRLPDWDNDFVQEDEIAAFAKALAAPDPSPSADDLTTAAQQPSRFITALNDWRPVHQRVRKTGASKKKKKKKPRRGKDETREGFVYVLLKWPLLLIVLGWILVLGAGYLATRLYIFLYEQTVVMRGQRKELRTRLQATKTYKEWVDAAKRLDQYFGNDRWKELDDYAYYNSETTRRVRNELRQMRAAIEQAQKLGTDANAIVAEMRTLLEAAVKNNFVGVENPRLYSETYYGTKNLVEEFIDEVQKCLKLLLSSNLLAHDAKAHMFRHMYTNYGRTALCLSGGATFAYYHFGVVKALLDAGVLPEVITGTSGGALVAALVGTRTDEELKQLLVPALAYRITACHDEFSVWVRRWWKTGARFDSVDWARRTHWFCHGNLTFKEAYERTGRILNVTCIPSDPHSPTVLANYRTSPDCVVWSAVIASAAVPGILNPVVLMRKNADGSLGPYSFGHKWKDGSLRTDIPLKALNTHFNVNFSIVSQVNPHINLFFFSSRGTVGRPVTHRGGRGWRGGFLGSATEQYLKLDLTKWLKVLRHLELLPRFVGQDWSEVWLQRFSGTITIWPKSRASDFVHILSDPSPQRLARMIHVGQQSAFPKLKFIANRMRVERLIDEGRRAAGIAEDINVANERRVVRNLLSEEDLRGLLAEARRGNGSVTVPDSLFAPNAAAAESPTHSARADSPSIKKRIGGWWSSSTPQSPRDTVDGYVDGAEITADRRSSVIEELGRQSRVFFDEPDMDETASEADGSYESVVPSDAEDENGTTKTS